MWKQETVELEESSRERNVARRYHFLHPFADYNHAQAWHHGCGPLSPAGERASPEKCGFQLSMKIPSPGGLHFPQDPVTLGGGRMGEMSEVTLHSLHPRALGSGR